MLNPMFYQYNSLWTIAIKHRKRIAEWEILVKKPQQNRYFRCLGSIHDPDWTRSQNPW